MNNLLNLQKEFQDYLLNENENIENQIVNTENVHADLRLMIYKNAYQGRLLEALESTYPVLKTLLDEDDFYELGQQYIGAYPSTFKSIRWFGDQLPLFLKQHENYSERPYLSELALTEWTMTLVFDAKDADIVTVPEVNGLPSHAWEALQIQFVPSMYILNLHWNVLPLWQAITDNTELPAPTESEAPVCWVLWRNELTNHYSSIADDEAFAINFISDGKTFGELCEGLCQYMDEKTAVTRAVTLFKGWIVSGMITRINY